MKSVNSFNITAQDYLRTGIDYVITLFYNMTPRVLSVQDGPHYAGLISNLSAYPNPFTAEAKLTLDLAEPSTLQVDAFDLTGRQVGQRAQVSAGHTELDLTHLIAGTGAYLVRLQATSAKGMDSRTVLVRRR
jgi:hypothetical protein